MIDNIQSINVFISKNVYMHCYEVHKMQKKFWKKCTKVKYINMREVEYTIEWMTFARPGFYIY